MPEWNFYIFTALNIGRVGEHTQAQHRELTEFIPFCNDRVDLQSLLALSDKKKTTLLALYKNAWHIILNEHIIN